MIAFLTNQIVLRGTAAACFMIGSKMLDYVVFYNARKRSKERQQKADEVWNKMLNDTQEQIRKEAAMKCQAQVDEWAKKMKEENEEWEQTLRKKTEERLEKARKIFDGHTRDMEKFKIRNYSIKCLLSGSNIFRFFFFATFTAFMIEAYIRNGCRQQETLRFLYF